MKKIKGLIRFPIKEKKQTKLLGNKSSYTKIKINTINNTTTHKQTEFLINKEKINAHSYYKNCPFLLSYGICTFGINCRYICLEMCYRDLKQRTCVKENCKFYHVKVTSRTIQNMKHYDNY